VSATRRRPRTPTRRLVGVAPARPRPRAPRCRRERGRRLDH
jgi:hypothetical protein